MIGTIVRWEANRGFGFVRTASGRDYFAHIKHWNENDPPAVGRTVEFEIGPGVKGRNEQAVNVRFWTQHAGLNALTSPSVAGGAL